MRSILTALQEGRLFELPDAGKARALEFLARILDANPDIEVGTDTIEEIQKRELECNTGIGMGVGEADVVAALDEVGPVGDFLSRTETRDAVRGGEWFMPRLGYHGTFDRWEAKGRPEIIDEAREAAAKTVAAHKPVPMSEDVAAALAEIERRSAKAG